MNEFLLPIHEIIKQAKNQGVDFGKGNPQNRLRYYTKHSLISQAKRKAVAGTSSRSTIAHYPRSIIKKLLTIQHLRKKGIPIKKIQEIINKEYVAVEEEISQVDKVLEHRQEISEIIIGTTMLSSFTEVAIRNTFPVLLIIGILFPSLLTPSIVKNIFMTPLILLIKTIFAPNPVLSFLFFK